MGVKFAKEYKDIIEDLTEAIRDIGMSHEFLEMEAGDWDGLDEEQQRECLTTLADDVFYGLGADPSLQLGTSHIIYDKDNHIIKVVYTDNVIRVVHLI
ncbi:hypothetical protein MJA45_23265 [Paenibacillus aurantius]|uniref:Uncharacterized protein n=1 Tax=Paenibacillus aurantius TaxID=2918900 RepID=A0AA96LC96_9BACL|nr:hypothetical protein [Paenibacillus aurantius]WNQ10508.1 hypothetical protein MJA45_23265 [Paenibacillus aurantius]